MIAEEVPPCYREDSGPGLTDDPIDDVDPGVVGEGIADDGKATLITEVDGAEDIAALGVLFEERAAAGKFILIEPSDLLTDEKRATAECSLSLVDDQESMELKRFIESELERKLQCLHAAATVPDKIRAATDLRDNY